MCKLLFKITVLISLLQVQYEALNLLTIFVSSFIHQGQELWWSESRGVALQIWLRVIG